MNRGDLVKYVGEELGLAYDVSGNEQDFLRQWATEGIVNILLETHCFLQIGDQDLTAGTAEYRLDASVLAIDDGRGSTPAGIGHYRVITLDEMISRQSVDPVSDSFRKFIAIEGDLLIVSPTPSTDETLRFYYVPKPTAMSNDSHDPSTITYGGIPTQFHEAIQAYMLWRGSRYDQKETTGARDMGPKDYFELYQGWLKKIVQYRRRMRDRRNPEPLIGYPSSRRPFISPNSMYPR